MLLSSHSTASRLSSINASLGMMIEQSFIFLSNIPQLPNIINVSTPLTFKLSMSELIHGSLIPAKNSVISISF